MSPCLGDTPSCYQMSINGVKKRALCPWPWNVLLFLPKHERLLMHSFIPTRKKKWEAFPCGRKLGISRSRCSPGPGFVLWAELPKWLAPRPGPTNQRKRDQYPSAPRLAFQVLSPRPCITDTIHIMFPVFTFLVD